MSASSPSLGVPDRPLRGILLMLLAVTLFTSHDAIAKYLVALYPVVVLAWFRYLSHTLLMAAIFLPRQGLRVLRSERPVLQFLRALCLLGVSLLFVNGLRYVPLAEATAVIFLAPLLVTALSVPLLGERVGRGQWLAVSAGFVGVLIIVRPGSALFTPAILWPMSAALCFAFYQLLTRKVSECDSPTTSNFLAGVINTLLVSLLLPFFWVTPQGSHLLSMLALGVIGMLAHLLLTHAFRYAAPATLAPFSYGQIVFAALLGWLLFGHFPEPGAVLGMALIVLAGLALVMAGQRKPG